MTDLELVRGIRILLHDTSDAYSTDNTFYSDEEIWKSADAARTELYKYLISRPSPAYVTCCRMIKTAAKVDGATVPSDFLFCICGYKNDGTYVPYTSLWTGEAFADMTGQDQVYISGGVVKGTMQNIEYWALPQEVIANNGTLFSEFPDAFYNTVKYGAVRNLLMKESTDGQNRWVNIMQEYQRKVSTLR